MTRLLFNQASSWGDDPYSRDRCCYCGRPIREGSPLLMLSRTEDGEWWLVSPTEELQPDEATFGRFSLPVGPDCLRKHPEWAFAKVL